MVWRGVYGKERFDLVHATALPYTSILFSAWLAARRMKARLCYTPFMHIGESDRDDVRKWYARRDQIDLLGQADAVFVQTPTERKFLTGRGVDSDRCHIIGVGINPEEILPTQLPDTSLLKDRYGLEGPFVFTLGAKSIDKGTATVVEAMKLVWQERPEVPLVLAGDEMSDFKQYWAGVPNDVRSKILPLGRISDEERLDLFRHGSIYLNPSRTDSFGITFLEAWTWGKPVIGARAGGVVDVIEDGNDGFLVDFGSATQLAEKILFLLDNPVVMNAFGKAGKQKTLKNYTWDKIYARILERYYALKEQP